MSKDVILTGIRANNDLHIGNYFGALLPMIDMAKTKSDEYEINLFVPDLHSFTTPIDHSKLQEQILHNLKIFVAAGLPIDNPNIHIYRQSHVPAHSELTWILDCFTGFGELSRMTQFKDKSKDQVPALIKKVNERVDESQDERYPLFDKAHLIIDKYEHGDRVVHTDFKNLYELMLEEIASQGEDHVESLKQLVSILEEAVASSKTTVGLFNYPVLMASDILLYGAKYVPVGDDQSQHLEFTRDIAERINKQFNEEIFLIPESVANQHEFFGKDQGLRIKDLIDPTKKMSKSDESGRGVIFLGDDPDDAARKVMNATTDSYNDGIKIDFDKRPGVSNLVQIFDLLKPGSRDEVMSLSNYQELKYKIAEVVKTSLSDFQSKLSKIDEAAIMRKLEADELAMNEVANATLLKVQKAVGLRPKD